MLSPAHSSAETANISRSVDLNTAPEVGPWRHGGSRGLRYLQLEPRSGEGKFSLAQFLSPLPGLLVSLALTVLILCLIKANLFAQGLLVDQASGTTGEFIQVFTQIPDNQIAQSFTPSLSVVGFVQFQTFVFDDNNGAGVMFAVNLRQGTYNGPILSSTAPVVLVNRLITQVGTFYYPGNFPVTPGQLYFFEPVLLSAGSLDIGYKNPSTYVGGNAWNNGLQDTGDYWFREGIVVPEPSAVWLFLFGGAVLLWRWRVERRSQV